MRYIIGLLIGIGLIVLLFVAIFHHGGSAPAPNQTNRLVDFANTSTIVELTDDYPVSADQTHHETDIVVGRDQTTFTADQGYQGTTLRTKSYDNNPTSYASFLRALQLLGFTNVKNDPNLQDERGYCPMGHRYIFQIKDGNRVIQRSWSTSCGNIGTFKGQTNNVRELFRRQVPDYNSLISGLDVSL